MQVTNDIQLGINNTFVKREIKQIFNEIELSINAQVLCLLVIFVALVILASLIFYKTHHVTGSSRR